MGRRLILDTSILIEYERGTIDRSALDEDELAIAAITVAEYCTGIELADSKERAAERRRALAAILEATIVLEYTASTAVHHARLIVHARREGRPRGAHDLIIAAHALESGRLLLSRDANAGFSGLPGVNVVTA